MIMGDRNPADGYRIAMYGYTEELRFFHLELKTEYEKFQNICEILLREVVDPTTAKLLLEPPSKETGEYMWKSHGVEKRLSGLYRDGTVSVICQSIRYMANFLGALEERFPVNQASKVSKTFTPNKLHADLCLFRNPSPVNTSPDFTRP